MARNRGNRRHDDLNLERTRASSVWVAVVIGVVFLILLIDFIAQNNRKVPVHFLWMDGTVSEAVALVMSAVAGAVLVLAVGVARIIQLRVVGRRHNRAMARQKKAARRGDSVTAAPQGKAQSVETKD
jgi:uncharacterized integral membrane protein